MLTEKTTRGKLLQPKPEEAKTRLTHQEETDRKAREIRERTRLRRVNYVVKDLPLY